MTTLNGGFKHAPGSAKDISQSDRDLINEFIRTRGVTDCPPSGVNGNEISPATHERVMKLRKEWRAARRAEAKARKG